MQWIFNVRLKIMLIFILCLLALYIVYFVNVQFIEILGNRILVKRERLHNMGFETIISRNFHELPPRGVFKITLKK